MAKIGNEFGSVTGRQRRCGWLDLVALKYAIQVNGVTQLMMMKGDVLSGFDTLKVATAYNYKGEVIKKTKDYITIRYYDVNHHFDRRYKIIDKVQRVKKIKLTPRIKELTS